MPGVKHYAESTATIAVLNKKFYGTEKDKEEPEKPALDTMVVMRRNYRPSSSYIHFLLLGTQGKFHTTSELAGKIPASAMPKDTVLLDAAQRRIVRNLTLEHNARTK